jgi:hypothetical protein
MDHVEMDHVEIASPVKRSFLAKAAASMTWLLPTAVVLAAMVLRLNTQENADDSWPLTLAEKLVDGRRDFIELNPPGAIFAYIPAVWLARIVGITPEAACNLLVFLLAAVSLGLVSLLLDPRYVALRKSPVVTTGVVATLLVLPMYAFGEREHLCVLLILPWAVALATRLGGRTPDWQLLVAAGIACGLCVMIKPHFILNVVVLSGVLAWRTRSFRMFFTLENCAAALLLVLYATILWTEFREFFVQTLPLVAGVYVPNRLDLATMIFWPASILWASTIAMTAATRALRRCDALTGVLLTMSGVSYLGFFLQGKGWPYQSYPAISFALLTLVILLGREAEGFAPGARRERALNVLFALGIFCTGMVWFSVQYPRDTIAIAETIDKIASRPGIAMIGGDVSVGFPVTRLVHGNWAQRAASRWMASSAHRLRSQPGTEPEVAAAMERYENLDRSMLLDDIRSNRPQIILIEAKPEDTFDWGAWARADPQLASELNAYEFVKQIDDVQIWRRR